MSKTAKHTGPSHPWRRGFKLKMAKKEYKRRYERGETKHGDKHKELNRERQRTKYRAAHGLDLERPPMTRAEAIAHARSFIKRPNAGQI